MILSERFKVDCENVYILLPSQVLRLKSKASRINSIYASLWQHFPLATWGLTSTNQISTLIFLPSVENN